MVGTAQAEKCARAAGCCAAEAELEVVCCAEVCGGRRGGGGGGDGAVWCGGGVVVQCGGLEACAAVADLDSRAGAAGYAEGRCVADVAEGVSCV